MDLRAFIQDLQVHLDGGQVANEGSSTIDTEHFRKNHLPNPQSPASQVWFSSTGLSGSAQAMS